METVAARIYGSIKEQIIDGRYAPGARITEQNIAAQFSTSRTPVREAMRQLVADGFALFKPNSGTVVRQWSPDEVRQLFELRLLIESQIAGHAAERIGTAQIAELEAIQLQIESGGVDVGAANTARIAPLNREFHRIIAQASEHERLVAMLANTIEVPIVQRTFRRYSRERLARSFTHHRELIEALAAHDSAWASSVMSSHIHSAKQTLLENPP
jgi:DNA-binding GntR family transcriptional regulator